MLLEARDCAARNEIDIVIVDPRDGEYTEWAQAMPARVAVCNTAGEALALANRKPALWVIHAELPDLSGLELHDKLRSLGRQATSLLVDDHYDANHELAALAHGNLIYRAKPLDFMQLRRMWAEFIDRLGSQRPIDQGCLLSSPS